MAVTLIRKSTEEGVSNLMFKTEIVYDQKDEGGEELVEQLIGKVMIVDNELNPLTSPTIYAIDETEEAFHKDLRQQAAKVGQLITSHSTDPEWNPEGYAKNLENEQGTSE